MGLVYKALADIDQGRCPLSLLAPLSLTPSYPSYHVHHAPWYHIYLVPHESPAYPSHRLYFISSYRMYFIPSHRTKLTCFLPRQSIRPRRAVLAALRLAADPHDAAAAAGPGPGSRPLDRPT